MKRIVIILAVLILASCGGEKQETSVPTAEDLQAAQDEWEKAPEAGQELACEMFKDPEQVEDLLNKPGVTNSQKAARLQVLEENC